MADFVVHRTRPSYGSRFGIFPVRGTHHLFEQDFERAKDAFAFLRSRYVGRNVSASKVYSNWLVYIR